MEIIIASVPCLVVTMVRSIIDADAGFPQTAALTLRTIHTALRILEPCQPEVSHMVSYAA